MAKNKVGTEKVITKEVTDKEATDKVDKIKVDKIKVDKIKVVKLKATDNKVDIEVQGEMVIKSPKNMSKRKKLPRKQSKQFSNLISGLSSVIV